MDAPLPPESSAALRFLASVPAPRNSASAGVVAEARPAGPARKEQPTSETAADPAVSSSPHAREHPPTPIAPSPSFQSCSAPAPPQARLCSANESSQPARVFPASNKPAAAKSPPNPLSRAAPIPHSPD